MKISKINFSTFALFFVFLFSFSACQKDFVNPKDSKKASAQKDGTPWVAYVNIRANKKEVQESIISLSFIINEDFLYSESISFIGAEINDERYEGQSYQLVAGESIEDIEPGQVAVSYGKNYRDVFDMSYQLAPCISSESFLTITSIDGKKISGIFSICIENSDGDVIEFSDGAFNGKIDWL